MMNLDSSTSTLPEALAGALRRLAQLVHTSSWDQWAAQRLTPTQRKILQLLGSRAESLSLSAVARELGVTAATACDSVNALEGKKLVRKQRSTTDARALALVLTEKGQEAAGQLAALPDPLRNAFGVLAKSEQEVLYRLYFKMIRGLQDSGSLPASRMCVRCKFFDPFRHTNAQAPHHCHRAEKALAESQLQIDCAIFEAGDASTQAALSRRFLRGEVPVEEADPVDEIEAPPHLLSAPHEAEPHGVREMALEASAEPREPVSV